MAEIKHVEPEFAGPRHNTPEQQADYKRVVAEYRAKTQFKCSVAPGGFFKTSRVVVRKPGEETPNEDFGDFLHLKSRAVSCGALVELSDHEFELAVGKGPFQVVTRTHTRNGGISVIGDLPKAEHYDRPGKPARQVVRDGCVVPAEAVPDVVASEKIKELIKMRFIAECKSREEVQAAIKQARIDHFERNRR